MNSYKLIHTILAISLLALGAYLLYNHKPPEDAPIWFILGGIWALLMSIANKMERIARALEERNRKP